MAYRTSSSEDVEDDSEEENTFDENSISKKVTVGNLLYPVLLLKLNQKLILVLDVLLSSVDFEIIFFIHAYLL